MNISLTVDLVFCLYNIQEPVGDVRFCSVASIYKKSRENASCFVAQGKNNSGKTGLVVSQPTFCSPFLSRQI